MRKIILLVLFFSNVYVGYSQDTVSENTPWYLYKSHGNLWYVSSGIHITQGGGHFIYQNYGKDPGDIYVYGVAVTFNYIPMEEERRNEAVTMTPTFMLLDHVAQGNPPTVSFLDSTNVLGKVQQCKFEYVLSDGTSEVVPSYEFYFDNPHHFVSPDDTFYVSFYWPEERATRYMDWWTNEVDQSGTYDMSTTFAIMYNAVTQESWGTSPEAGIFDFNPNYSINRVWGLIFPIVQLRCSAPYLSMAEREGDAATVRWWQAEAGESYQVALGTFGGNPDSSLIITTTDTFHTFNGLRPDTLYSAWVRKACRYTTTGYDTLVWSEWSRPVQFFMVGIGEVDDLALRVAAREGCIVVEGLDAGEGAEVYDMLGRRVAALPADGATAPLPAGLYLVRTTAHSRPRRVAVLR